MVTLPTIGEESRRAPATLVGGFRRALSFPVLLGVLLFAGSYAVSKDRLHDSDMWWHIAIGRQILATHTLPRSDTYSSTVAGAPWIAYEWLGEVAIGAAASVAGLPSAAFLLVALSGILVLLLYYYAILKGGDSKAAFVACALVLPVLGAFFTLRPQLLGAIFLVLTLILVERFRRGEERALWFLPLLFLVWVNTHGSFVFGFLILGVAWLSGQVHFSRGGMFSDRWTKRQSVQFLLAILASVLVLPVTPYGGRLAAYPLTFALSQPLNVASIREWAPLGGQAFAYVVVLLLGFCLALLVERPRFRFQDVALAMLGAFAAWLHVRFLLLLAIFLAPLLAEMLARWIPRYRPDLDRLALNAGLIALVAVGIVFFFPSRRRLEEQSDAEYPRSALRYLTDHPIKGTLLNDYTWGGYMIWAAPQSMKVFIDGRADLYEYGGVMADYVRINWLQPDALQLLKRYNVGACLIPRESPLATTLGALPEWHRVYEDQLAAVYTRKSLIAH